MSCAFRTVKATSNAFVRLTLLRYASTQTTVQQYRSRLESRATSDLRPPCFPVQGDDLEILASPSDFHTTLREGFRQARSRVVIASLYLGTDPRDQELVIKSSYSPLTWHRLMHW